MAQAALAQKQKATAGKAVAFETNGNGLLGFRPGPARRAAILALAQTTAMLLKSFLHFEHAIQLALLLHGERARGLLFLQVGQALLGGLAHLDPTLLR